MSPSDAPSGSKHRLTGCGCGRHASESEHDAFVCAAVAENEEQRYRNVVAAAVLRAMVPQLATRRAFVKSVGSATALAALAQVFPLKTATELLAAPATPEKKNLKVGFIPITCATPIIMAH
ncbi:MAG: nitrate ABC transporter substrate-binding protein, partial [Alphaproteobacteria bacterium]|nr:nitrate ABC transporter substrate-binding protein [Alphaproteobacteria bacterium]